MSRGLQLVVFLFWVGIFLVPADRAFGQPADECEKPAELFEGKRVVVPLDNLGIGRWEYRNPRKPYPLTEPTPLPADRRPAGQTVADFQARQARCRTEARKAHEVIFDNRSIDRNFDVEFKFNLPFLTRASFEDLENLEILSRRRGNPRPQVSRIDSQLIRDVKVALPLALAGLYPAIEQGTGTDADLARELSDIRNYLASLDDAQKKLAKDEEIGQELANLQARKDELAQLPPTGIVVQQREQVERDIAETEKARTAVASAQQEIAAAEDLQKLRPRIDQALGADVSQETEWTLAYDTAITSLMGDGSDDPNQVKASDVPVGEGFRRVCSQAVADLKNALERETLPEGAEESRDLARALNNCYDAAESFFNSLGTDRFFRESGLGSGILRLADLVEELEKRKPLRLREVCKKESADTLACTFKLFVPGNTPAQLPPGVIAALPQGLVEYQVRFRGEDVIPQYSKGFFATIKNPSEPASRFAWTLLGKVGFSADPDPDSTPDEPQSEGCNLADPKCDPIIPYSPTVPYEGETRRRFPGSSLLQLGAFLGNRAQAQVDFGFKSGDLGGLDGDGQTKVQQYTFEVFSLNGWGLKFGRYTLANPALNLATRESGEGFEILYKNISLGYIAQRESIAREATDKDEDKETYIFQLKNISTENATFFRGLSALALAGEEQDPQTAYEYWTAGAEVFLAQPASRITGSLAYYYSERKPKGGPKSPRRGEGSTGLLTAGGWWPDKKGEVARKLDVRVGFGSGDEPETRDLDEGYIGDTSRFFSAGTFFLGNVAGLIEDPRSEETPRKSLSPGLSNKIFAGLVFTDKTFSPLMGIASLLKTGDQVVSQSTTIKLHGFLFDEKVYGSREAGWEAGVEFTMEAPSGVTSSLEFFGFVPGDALETVLEDIPWAIRSSVTVKIF